MTPRPRTAVMAAFALVTFGLAGTVGVAEAAASLTKGQVKSIAKGVVKKQAKKLTVNNASNLGGQPPAAYQDDAIVWTISVDSAATYRDIPLQLPPGQYWISYSAYMSSGGSNLAGCYLHVVLNGVSRYVGSDYIDTSIRAVSGTGHVNLAAGDTVNLFCSSGTAWTTTSGEPIQVVAVPLDTVTAHTMALP
jgi:hypothetical protein